MNSCRCLFCEYGEMFVVQEADYSDIGEVESVTAVLRCDACGAQTDRVAVKEPSDE